MDIMKHLKHPNIIKLMGVCTQELPLCIVTEFMPRGSLLDYMSVSEGKTVEIAIIIYLAQQVGLGMLYLESMRIIHR